MHSFLIVFLMCFSFSALANDLELNSHQIDEICGEKTKLAAIFVEKPEIKDDASSEARIISYNNYWAKYEGTVQRDGRLFEYEAEVEIQYAENRCDVLSVKFKRNRHR